MSVRWRTRLLPVRWPTGRSSAYGTEQTLSGVALKVVHSLLAEDSMRILFADRRLGSRLPAPLVRAARPLIQ
jgi:hypothetical protein